MAAGVTIKHKRKTSNFSSGQLGAAELGLNTTSSQWNFSPDGTAVDVIPTSQQVSSLSSDLLDLTNSLASTDNNLSTLQNKQRYTVASVVSTSNVSIASAPASIDGYTMATGDTILLVGQTSSSENGLYMFAGSGSAMGRLIPWAGNNNSGYLRLCGVHVWVTNGTIGKQTFWYCSNQHNLTDSLGTVSITFLRHRFDRKVRSTASESSYTPDTLLYDEFVWTALAAGLSIGAPSYSNSEGDQIIFRIKDNGTTRTLSWNAAYRAIGVTLPTSTTPNKLIYVGCKKNADGNWDVLAVAQEQ